MMVSRRGKLLVDRKIQGALLSRVVLYWFYCTLSLVLMVTLWIVWTQKPSSSADLWQRIWLQVGPPAGAAVILLPTILIDLLRLTNRMVGPITRLRRAMKHLAIGHADVEPVVFREGDFWYDFAEDFNLLLRRVQPEGCNQLENNESSHAGAHEPLHV